MFPCEKLAYSQSLPPKIVHERAFYMGTCVEGDSAQNPSWRGQFVELAEPFNLSRFHVRVAMFGRHVSLPAQRDQLRINHNSEINSNKRQVGETKVCVSFSSLAVSAWFSSVRLLTHLFSGFLSHRGLTPKRGGLDHR